MGSRKPRDFAGIVRLEPPALNLLALPSPKLLVALAARRWAIEPDQIASATRDPLVVAARHHAMWLLRTHTSLSLERIGRLLGGRDHKTVICGIAAHEKRMAGEMPLPFVWTHAKAWEVLRYAYGGDTLGGIARRFAISDVALKYHPRFGEIKGLALRHAAADRVARLRALQPGAAT